MVGVLIGVPLAWIIAVYLTITAHRLRTLERKMKITALLFIAAVVLSACTTNRCESTIFDLFPCGLGQKR